MSDGGPRERVGGLLGIGGPSPGVQATDPAAAGAGDDRVEVSGAEQVGRRPEPRARPAATPSKRASRDSSAASARLPPWVHSDVGVQLALEARQRRLALDDQRQLERIASLLAA